MRPLPEGDFMDAIEITEENLQKIIQRIELKPHERVAIETYYLRKERKWYFVTGYYAPWSPPLPWTVLPEYILRSSFEIDFQKAQTEWDQIVRK
jgi:hypothetical protein